MGTEVIETTPTRFEGDSGLKTLISPVAAYIAATDDPRMAVVEVISELISQAIAIEVAAHRYLTRQETRQRPGNR